MAQGSRPSHGCSVPPSSFSRASHGAPSLHVPPDSPAASAVERPYASTRMMAG